MNAAVASHRQFCLQKVPGFAVAGCHRYEENALNQQATRERRSLVPDGAQATVLPETAEET